MFTTREYSWADFIITVEGPFKDWYYNSEIGQETTREFWRAFQGRIESFANYQYGETEEEAIGKVVVENFRCSRIEEKED